MSSRTTTLVQLRLDPVLVALIDNWRSKRRPILSRAQLIRELLDLGVGTVSTRKLAEQHVRQMEEDLTNQPKLLDEAAPG